MPKVKGSDLATNVQVTERKDGRTVKRGWFGPNYPETANETVDLEEGHPALVPQRVTQEELDRLQEAPPGTSPGGLGPDLRATAADFGRAPGDVPNLRQAELDARAAAGAPLPGEGAVAAAALPPLPEGWDKKGIATLKAYAEARGVTVAPNAKDQDLVEQLRATGA